ncbi:MAG: hypothetical protein LBC77_00590 [Spirochaetaceae bacterium]|nr:hypothetical protein [Spirochaetaceae bacterium]
MEYLFSSLALLVSVFTFFYLRFWVVKRTSSDRLLEDKRGAAREIINEIDRVTDRDAVLIERRVEELKSILADADRRILTLGRELEGRQRRDEAYAEIGRKKKAGLLPKPKNDTALFDQPAAQPALPAAPEPPAANKLSRSDEIVLLSASGNTPAEIAAKLDMTITEVEITLVLRKQRH